MLRWALKGAWLLGFDCLVIYDFSVDCYVGVVIIAPMDHFSWDLPVDRSFEMTIDSSNKVSRVRDILIIGHFVRPGFSQKDYEILFYSWFNHSDSSTEHLLRLMESLLDPFNGSRFVMTHHTKVFFSLHHSLTAWHLEPPSYLQFGIHSHFLFAISGVWDTIFSSFRRLKPLLLILGIQSHFFKF